MSEYFDDSIYEQQQQPQAPHQEPEQQMPQMAHTPRKEKKSHKGAVALVLCCALVGGGCGVGGAFLGNSLASRNQPTTVYSDGVSTIMKGVRETSTLQVQQIDSSKELTGAEVYAANVNSTVGIVTSLVTTNFWGQQTTGAAAGSGFIFSDDGYILTNYHVVSGATAITVSTYDGTNYDAKVVGFDESNDVAVLKIEAEGLTPVVIGDSDKLNVGDEVVAIGNPLGADLLGNLRHHQCPGPGSHHFPGLHHGPDPDRLRHQLRQLRRRPVQHARGGHRHHQRQVFQLFFLLHRIR